jgi:hypothetical protein
MFNHDTQSGTTSFRPLHMQHTDVFSVSSVDEVSGLCEVSLRGSVIGREFVGAQIADQYACSNSRYLVCLNFGSLWDDALNIYLLDSEGRALDAISGGGAMSAGAYEARGCTSNSLDFKFFDDEILTRVTVNPSKQFRLLLPKPWHYRNMLSAHFLRLQNFSVADHHV